MKPIVLHPAAEAEMLAAARYYQNCQAGLGRRFLDEVSLTGKRITENPVAWPLISGSIRRCLLNRFPFGLIFRVEMERVYVLAVMHLRREPGYWCNRIR
ncbi:MAG TPA: type II toxin-antitoxin system RelE/ParE family toxin [Desulfuromonadales bacterium]|nr:type II toxin-antitoxin system RelE/ParE family toxin [Desulfuromonadales bacterium]